MLPRLEIGAIHAEILFHNEIALFNNLVQRSLGAILNGLYIIKYLLHEPEIENYIIKFLKQKRFKNECLCLRWI